MKHTRRNFLTSIVPGTIGTAVGLHGPSNPSEKKMKIVVVGAHPDDPETMCGGLLALCSGVGHEVVAAYLTRGESGIKGKSPEETARIRTAEAQKACSILNVRPEFLGQINGNCEITKERYAQMAEFLKKEEPDIIFTHWPIDTHREHGVCSVLVHNAWLQSGKKSDLYYCEVMTGIQTQNFSPTDYVNISDVADQKHKACFAHASQNIEATYPGDHGRMEVFRGMEAGCQYAEAFVRHVKSPGNSLLRLF